MPYTGGFDVQSSVATEVYISPAGNIVGSLEFAQELLEANLYSDLIRRLNEAGWVTSHLLLSVGEWRYSWESETHKTM